MKDDYVGLNIGGEEGDGRCSATKGDARCELLAGHQGPHEAKGYPYPAGAEDGPDCPDCGGPLVPFTVNAPDEETSLRAYIAYIATQDIPMEVLQAVARGEVHLHTVKGDGKDCED